MAVALCEAAYVKRSREYRRRHNLKLSNIYMFPMLANLLRIIPLFLHVLLPTTFLLAQPAPWSLWSDVPGQREKE